jgi:CO/xanthine dehydrogenase Mo-binding subunit
LQALVITWDEGTHATLSTADIVRDLEEAAKAQGLVARKDGNASEALMTATRRIDATYEVPMLAHATMEPPNCLIHVRSDGCEVWVGTQVPTFAQQAVAAVTGLSPDKVKIHNQYLGGGFGRRLEVDFIEQTARIAKTLNRPVKIVWTREEDIQHDLYRPYYYDRLSAGLDKGGDIVAWTHRIVGPSVTARFAPS